MIRFPQVGFPIHPELHIRSEMARLDPELKMPQLSVDVDRNGYDIHSTPAKLVIDNRPYFDSVGLKSTHALSEEWTEKARQAAWDSAAHACENGDAVAEGGSMESLAFLQLTHSIHGILRCVQPEKPVIACEKAELSIDYTKDNYTFSWDIQMPHITYQPYSIETWVEFQDKVE